MKASIFKSALIMLIVIVIATSSVSLGSEKKKADLTTIRIIVEQSYKKDWYGSESPLTDVNLPIEEICRRLLNTVGIEGTGQDAQQFDGTISVILKGIAIGRAFAIYELDSGGTGRQVGQGPSFSGAKISGEVTIEHKGKNVQKKFNAEKPLPAFVSTRLGASEAPFRDILFDDGSLVPIIMENIEQVWEIKTANSPKAKKEIEKLKSELIKY